MGIAVLNRSTGPMSDAEGPLGITVFLILSCSTNSAQSVCLFRAQSVPSWARCSILSLSGLSSVLALPWAPESDGG